MAQQFKHLTTIFEQQLTDNPFSLHPRPQFQRESYISLNGWWDFCLQSKGGDIKKSSKILVPFCPESRISGVFFGIEKGDVMVYSRDFTIPRGFNKGKVILHVDECDQSLTVTLNAKKVYRGEGVLPHQIDVTEFLQTENHIEITAKDDLDLEIPYGKQKTKRGGMWYTKTSGIKKSVWLESVPKEHITDLKIKTDLTSATFTVKGGCEKKTIIVCDKEYHFYGEQFKLEIESPKLWSPTNPHLYYFTFICGEDKVNSYFGLREFSVGKVNGKPMLLLNGEPIFCHGLLDQGYYSDGIYLPSTEKGFEYDILQMKKLGFNTLRKHIKLEPEIFYYYCDKYGMLVFQDMINNGRYSFLIDTALPTLFLKKGIRHRATKRRKELFINTALGIMNSLYNHPSVVYYTIFNEGWGQFGEKECYELFKNTDDTRVYDTTSGWFKKQCTDVESDHVYFKKIKGKKTKKPWLLTEFGGYSYKIKENSFNQTKTYGYKYFDNSKSFNQAINDLYKEQIIPAINSGLCGCILTQVSDVEDETNGLLTYDRKVTKLNEDFITTSNQLYQAFISQITNEKDKN